MSTYVIGDVHGCFDELITLLELFKFDRSKDKLWFTGDLVNGGPSSIETLRYVKDLGDRAITVLGNHDLTLIALATGHLDNKPQIAKGFQSVLQANDCLEVVEWLCQQPFTHFDPHFNTLLLHAGIYPQWTFTDVLTLAEEASQVLRHSLYEFLPEMFGNTPLCWENDLAGWVRIRFIINVLTRIRYCYSTGALDFQFKGKPCDASPELLPWYQLIHPSLQDKRIIFGHWSALMGQVESEHIIAMDTGCMWGNQLSAYCLETQTLFHVGCPEFQSVTQ